MIKQTTEKRGISDNPNSLVGDFISLNDELPNNSFDWRCIIVFDDGYEAKSDGGTVCQSSIAKGWRKITTDCITEVREMRFIDGRWSLPNVTGEPRK